VNDKPYYEMRAWLAMTGSFAYYIELQVKKAREKDAPDKAVYFDDLISKPPKRITLDEVQNKQAVVEVKRRVGILKGDAARAERESRKAEAEI
jgi:hypothetical protein